MNKRTQWDDDFLNNLKKGFEPLAKNDFSCIIMEADSSLMWILVRNKVSEPYQLVWKLTYRMWKDLIQAALKYSDTHNNIKLNHCICRYVPVGNVLLQHLEKGWLFTGTFAYFIKAVQEADKNILKIPSGV